MGKLHLLLLFLSVSLTSTLAIRYTNPDKQHELGQCMGMCAKWRFTEDLQRECFRDCQDRFGGQGRRSWGDDSSDELVELMINPQHHGEQSRYEECRRDCQRQGQRGQGQQWQCQKGCDRYRRERDGEDDDNQGRFDPEVSRKCQQLCRGKGYECQRRCVNITNLC